MSFWDEVERLKRLLREQRRLFERLFAEDVWEGLYPETSLSPEEPLYSVEDLGESYRVIVDLPAINPSSLRVDVLVDRIIVEAEIDVERLSGSPGWTREERYVKRYRAVIRLPEPVEPRRDLVKVYRRAELLILVIPKARGKG